MKNEKKKYIRAIWMITWWTKRNTVNLLQMLMMVQRINKRLFDLNQKRTRKKKVETNRMFVWERAKKVRDKEREDVIMKKIFPWNMIGFRTFANRLTKKEFNFLHQFKRKYFFFFKNCRVLFTFSLYIRKNRVYLINILHVCLNRYLKSENGSDPEINNLLIKFARIYFK